jgi:hypothetical protein
MGAGRPLEGEEKRNEFFLSVLKKGQKALAATAPPGARGERKRKRKRL